MTNENIETPVTEEEQVKKPTRRRTAKPKVEEAVETEQVVEEKKAPEKPKKISAKDVDLTQYITVINGYQGQLIYKSKRTGEEFKWGEFGDEQEIELRTLKDVKSTNKKFFTNNWFMFSEDDDWVLDYLGIRQYYKHALTVENFDDIFEQKPAQLEKTLAGLSKGQKRSVAYRARTLINEKQIDSLSVIDTLEKGLGVELIEK